jgi:hypothetical protein
MIKFFKRIFFKIKSHFLYKKRLKELRKRDPFIYK